MLSLNNILDTDIFVLSGSMAEFVNFQYLEDYVYEKLWSELSRGDKKILYAIAKTKNAKAKDIMEIAGIKNNEYTPYRKRLIKKMVVDGDEYGYLKLTLPLFDEFILRQ